MLLRTPNRGEREKERNERKDVVPGPAGCQENGSNRQGRGMEAPTEPGARPAFRALVRALGRGVRLADKKGQKAEDECGSGDVNF